MHPLTRPALTAFVSLTSLMATALLVTGCAGTKAPQQQQHLNDVIAAPLHDLNLVRNTIPAILQDAHKRPYAMPAQTSCQALSQEITALNTELAEDIDIQESTFDINAPDITAILSKEKVTDSLLNEVTNELGRTITGFVPYRRWIRLLSGANLHDKHINTAINAGNLRRAYLKGMYALQSCPPLPKLLRIPAVALPQPVERDSTYDF
jgi:hypothetical protein